MATKKESPQEVEIETNAAADTAAEPAEAPAGEEAPKEKSMEDYVEIMIPRSEKNPGPVFIGVNGENVLVKRGEFVKVRRKFAEALKLSFQQENASADYQDMLVREYKEAKM